MKVQIEEWELQVELGQTKEKCVVFANQQF